MQEMHSLLNTMAQANSKGRATAAIGESMPKLEAFLAQLLVEWVTYSPPLGSTDGDEITGGSFLTMATSSWYHVALSHY